mmetsp:Transcript_17345/g.34531  ORF Transcript_17345/g.34531 Transcript_17345/m.34531 type:complete len:520 (-) Transcript_17345:227-1786(-)
MLLGTRPAPNSVAPGGRGDGDGADFGTLSSLLGTRQKMYRALPDWADVDSPAALRDPPKPLEDAAATGRKAAANNLMEGSDFSDTDDTDSSDGSDDSDSASYASGSEEESSDDETSSGTSGSDEDTDRDDAHRPGDGAPPAATFRQPTAPPPDVFGSVRVESVTDSDASDSDDDDGSDSASTDDDGAVPPLPTRKESSGLVALPLPPITPEAPPTDIMSLLDGFYVDGGSTMAAPKAAPKAPALSGLEGLVMSPVAVPASSAADDVGTDYSHRYTMLRPELGGGLSCSYCFVRGKALKNRLHERSLSASGYVGLEMRFENQRNDTGTIRRVRIVQRGGDAKATPPLEIAAIGKGKMAVGFMAIDYGMMVGLRDIGPVRLEIKTDRGTYPVEFRPPIGELLVPTRMDKSTFEESVAKVTGFHRNAISFSIDGVVSDPLAEIPERIMKSCNVAPVDNNLTFTRNQIYFSAALPSTGETIMLSITLDDALKSVSAVICCEDAIVSSTLTGSLKKSMLDAPTH